MHEECIGDVHGTELFTLTTVDTGVRNVCKSDQMEHETWWELTWSDVPWLLG